MRLLEGSALYILGGVTVVGVGASFVAGMIVGVYFCAKGSIDLDKYLNKDAKDTVEVTED